jgi:MoaA/NifB/PqqE/SkfB family radical SAM enzyme
MMVQVEITTRCNFDCFYCAGRVMQQGDMAYETFTALLERHVSIYGLPDVVSLQGEGEPTLHHDFFRMAEFARGLGATPYTITNGTHKHPDYFVGLFPRLGVSVDALDETTATKIGRYNLPRVLAFVEQLAPHLRIVIHSVAHREHTPAVAEWCRRKGYSHVVQPLQTKRDYGMRYAVPREERPATGRFSCPYLTEARMRYYALDGTEMPCCFIKDTAGYRGMEAMLEHQRAGMWPQSCTGCRHGAQPSQDRLRGGQMRTKLRAPSTNR